MEKTAFIKEKIEEIYHEITAFLDAYKAKNTSVLKERFGIQGQFGEEIYEMLDFVKDKNRLHLFAIGEITKKISGKNYLDIFEFNEDSESFGNYGIECALFMNKEHIGYIMGEYRIDDSFPRFKFHYFSV